MPLVVANWKMNLKAKDRKKLVSEVIRGLRSVKDVEVVLCPSFISLQEVGAMIRKTKLKLGAQDVFWEEKGAYTGEVSPLMLEETNCEYVIIGHSERRKYLNETDEMVHRKLGTALEEGLTPILCVGETFEERQEGSKDYVIIRQLSGALEGIEMAKDQQLVVAYEPVWVIGSGQAVNPEEAGMVKDLIRQTLLDLFPLDIVENNIRIIYGGSVDHTNVRPFLEEARLRGVLVGGASLEASEFINIVKSINQ